MCCNLFHRRHFLFGAQIAACVIVISSELRQPAWPSLSFQIGRIGCARLATDVAWSRRTPHDGKTVVAGKSFMVGATTMPVCAVGRQRRRTTAGRAVAGVLSRRLRFHRGKFHRCRDHSWTCRRHRRLRRRRHRRRRLPRLRFHRGEFHHRCGPSFLDG